MSTIALLVSPKTYMASLGAMVDAHARLGEVFESNPALGDYAQMETRLVLAPTIPGRCDLAGGRPLQCDTNFAALADVRIAYLPSFQVIDPDGIDALLEPSRPFHDWLGHIADAGAHIGASGASVFHLAAAGLLDGQACAVPPRLESAFRHRFPKVLVEDATGVGVAGRLFTCSRDSECPALVNRLFAFAFSWTLARSLALRELPWDHSQQPNVSPDPLVARAQFWIRDRFTRDFRIADLASELGVTHQALIRRFRAAGEETPRNYVQRLRVDAAVSMLVETNRSIAEIAQLVGYGNVPSFRDVFAAVHGMSPGAYRKRHRHASLDLRRSEIRHPA